MRRKATEVIHYVSRATHGRLPIIGVGGITDAVSAAEKMDAGATLVQVYTGLVYEGPSIARAIVQGLDRRLREAGLNDLHEAVGIH